MKRVLIDTNVLMDYLFKREPFAADAKTIWDGCVGNLFHGVMK